MPPGLVFEWFLVRVEAYSGDSGCADDGDEIIRIFGYRDVTIFDLGRMLIFPVVGVCFICSTDCLGLFVGVLVLDHC